MEAAHRGDSPRPAREGRRRRRRGGVSGRAGLRLHDGPGHQGRRRPRHGGLAVLDQQLVAFAIVAAIVTIIPGADMALVARSVLTHGRRAGYVTSLGVCTGLWVHAVASAFGLSAVLMTSATLFSAVKLGGAV